MAALASRFCSPSKIAKYFGTKQDGSLREGWELSIPFLERAKSLLIPLLGMASCDVICALILLSLAEFENNSEAGKSFWPMLINLEYLLTTNRYVHVHRNGTENGSRNWIAS